MSMSFALSAGFSGLRASLQLLGTAASEIGGSGEWTYDQEAAAVAAAQAALAPAPHVRSGPAVEPGKQDDEAQKPAIVPTPEMMSPGATTLSPGAGMDFTGALTTMLMARRAFEANAHVIATSNRELGTLITLTV